MAGASRLRLKGMLLATILCMLTLRVRADSEAFSLNTYLLSAASFSLLRDYDRKDSFNLTVPISSMPALMHVMQPVTTGMQHSFLNTHKFLEDLAVLHVAATGKGIPPTGCAAAAQFIDPAGTHPECHEQFMEQATIRAAVGPPSSLLLGIDGTQAMAVFNLREVSLPTSGIVLLKLELVADPHAVSEFEQHPSQKLNHNDEHYHFFTNGGHYVDADAFLKAVDNLQGMQYDKSNTAVNDAAQYSHPPHDRHAVMFLKGRAKEPNLCVSNEICGGGGLVCCHRAGNVNNGCGCYYPSNHEQSGIGEIPQFCCGGTASGDECTGSTLTTSCRQDVPSCPPIVRTQDDRRKAFTLVASNDMCVQSLDGCGARLGDLLTYGTDCKKRALEFKLTDGGQLKLSKGKLCVGLRNDATMRTVSSGTPLVWYDNCELRNGKPADRRWKFRNGALQHIHSGMCVHPEGDRITQGAKLVLKDGCGSSSIRFDRVKFSKL